MARLGMATFVALLTFALSAHAQDQAQDKKISSKWYERLSIRGYTQVRYNNIAATNDDLTNPGDRFIGPNSNLSIRRARIVISGDVHEHVSVYLQPDFAVAIGDQLNVAIMRDWYADIFFDKLKEFRLRVGQSKVPFGYENLQSSSVRLPFDRADAFSTFRDERDVGVFFYWAPDEIRDRFKYLASNLKGSGDYGVFALGVFNGQGANTRDLNPSMHVVSRVTWPFLIGEQYLEVGGGGYAGRFTPRRAAGIGGDERFNDIRGAISFVLYPQPFGIQAEWNVGVGPQLVDGAIEDEWLNGGYVLLSYNAGAFFPYARASYFDGARKNDTNTPRFLSREIEAGVEWQINKALELTAAYNVARRTNVALDTFEDGGFGRLQLQFSY